MTDKAAHHFAAPTSVVFTILADPERAARWLAPGPGPQKHLPYRLSVVPAELSVRWAPQHDGGWTGRAIVRDAIGGGSVVYLELLTADPATDRSGRGDLVSDTMRRLAAEVAEVAGTAA